MPPVAAAFQSSRLHEFAQTGSGAGTLSQIIGFIKDASKTKVDVVPTLIK
jgi:hypothetical protein